MKYVYKSVWHRLADYLGASLVVLGVVLFVGFVIVNAWSQYEYQKTLYDAAQKQLQER